MRVEHRAAISFFDTWGQQGVEGSVSQHRRCVIAHGLLTFWNVIDFFFKLTKNNYLFYLEVTCFIWLVNESRENLIYPMLGSRTWCPVIEGMKFFRYLDVFYIRLHPARYLLEPDILSQRAWSLSDYWISSTPDSALPDTFF